MVREHTPEHEAGRGGEELWIVTVVSSMSGAATAATSRGRVKEAMIG